MQEPSKLGCRTNVIPLPRVAGDQQFDGTPDGAVRVIGRTAIVEELLELVELEVRELLSSYEFPGDDIPIVKVSALKALEGDAQWTESIVELMNAVDSYIPEPTREIGRAHV